VATSFSTPKQAAVGAAVSANNWFGHSISADGGSRYLYTNSGIHTPAPAQGRFDNTASIKSNSSFFNAANGPSQHGSDIITRTPSKSYDTPRRFGTPYFGDEENRQQRL
jgi:hypothetical protein